MPRPLLTALLVLAVVPSLCLGEDPGEKKLSSAEKKAQDQAAKLQELLGSLGVPGKPAELAGKRYEEFRLKGEADQKKEIDRLVENFDFASGAGAHRDAMAHLAARGIRPGSGGHATADSLMDAKNEFSRSRKENPTLYGQYLTDPKVQDILLKRHGVQPPDLEASRPVVFGDARCLDARKAELKLQPLLKLSGLPPDHAVWVLCEVKGLADLVNDGPGAKASEGKDEPKEKDEDAEGPPRRRRWR